MKIRSILAVLFLIFAGNSHAEIRLWVTDGVNNGANFGGREGVDAFCNADDNKPDIPNTITRAFISVDENDEIQDMPDKYGIPEDVPIRRPDVVNTLIASNFDALLNADITPPSKRC